MKLKKGYWGILFALSSIVGCAKVEFGRDVTSFEQTVTINNEVDILFVVDNSKSMSAEQQNLANLFPNFTYQLTNMDWQIGIITTDVSGTNAFQDGRLVRLENRPNEYVLKPSTPSANYVFKKTVQILTEGSGDERGIYAAVRAMERAEYGLFRNNADLAVVILSDEDNRSYGGSHPFYPLEVNKDRPEDLINTALNMGPSKQMSVHSIVINEGDEQCFNEQDAQPQATAHYGTTYSDLSRLIGFDNISGLKKGIVGDICARTQNYTKQLQDISDIIRNHRFEFGCDPKDLQVSFNIDIPNPPAMGVEGTQYVIDGNLPVGTEINYKWNCYNLNQ